MAASYQDLVSERHFRQAAYAMIVLASFFIIGRIGIQIRRRKSMQLQDYLLYTAYILFLAMSITYLVVISKAYMIERLSRGLLAPWPTMPADVVMFVRVMFATTILFWLSLWLVKLSLLILYKKLIAGLPSIYMRLWWAVFVFCVISLVGCIVSYLTACDDFAESIETGACYGPRSLRGKLASLYYAYAVDVLSDFMSRLTWVIYDLQAPRGQKIAIIGLFASGFVVVVFATLRVVQIGRRAGDSKSPNSTWLALWTMIETSLAVCIGCCPAFAFFYCATHSAGISYDADGHRRKTQSRSGGHDHQLRSDAIGMDSISSRSGGSRASIDESHCEDSKSSQRALADDNESTMVMKTLHKDQEQETHRNSSSFGGSKQWQPRVRNVAQE